MQKRKHDAKKQVEHLHVLGQLEEMQADAQQVPFLACLAVRLETHLKKMFVDNNH